MIINRATVVRHSAFLTNAARLNPDQPRRLWAICAEVMTAPNQWESTIHHVHAHDKGNAISQFLLQEFRPVKIVDAAPILGYFVEDDHGEKLIA